MEEHSDGAEQQDGIRPIPFGGLIWDLSLEHYDYLSENTFFYQDFLHPHVPPPAWLGPQYSHSLALLSLSQRKTNSQAVATPEAFMLTLAIGTGSLCAEFSYQQ